MTPVQEVVSSQIGGGAITDTLGEVTARDMIRSGEIGCRRYPTEWVGRSGAEISGMWCFCNSCGAARALETAVTGATEGPHCLVDPFQKWKIKVLVHFIFEMPHQSLDGSSPAWNEPFAA